MVAGLFGNALGYDHRDARDLPRLQDRLLLAAPLGRAGRVLVDYPTAHLNKRDPLWTTRGTPAERGGGGSTWDEDGFGTVERWRHYLADAVVTVAVALDPPNEPPTVDDLAAALHRPERPLFLGRKGCPPATGLPLRGPLEAASLAAALDAVPLPPRAAAGLLPVELPDHAGEPDGDRVVARGRAR